MGSLYMASRECKCRRGGLGINVTYEDPMDTAAAGDAAGADGTAGGSAPATPEEHGERHARHRGRRA